MHTIAISLLQQMFSILNKFLLLFVVFSLSTILRWRISHYLGDQTSWCCVSNIVDDVWWYYIMHLVDWIYAQDFNSMLLIDKFAGYAIPWKNLVKYHMIFTRPQQSDLPAQSVFFHTIIIIKMEITLFYLLNSVISHLQVYLWVPLKEILTM